MSTLLTTTNNGFQYPTAANNGADFATGVADLANSLDAMWLAPGTISAQPAASTVPRFAIYAATDTGTISQCTGTAWLQIWPALQVVSTASPAAGDYDIVDAGVTATLPAPTLNAIIALEANAGVSGSAPCYFAASDMFGPGIPDGPASLAIGTPGTVMWFIAEGSTRWRVLAGQQDTGWQALTLGGGVSSADGFTPAARQIGDRVILQGALSGSSITAWGTVPYALSPSATAKFGPFIGAGVVSIDNTGAITSSAASTIALNGFSYPSR